MAEQENVRRVVRQVPFTFLGNENGCTVRKDPRLGDGDIATGDGGTVYVTVSGSLQQPQADRLVLNLVYTVWESSWEKGKSKADRLSINASQVISLPRAQSVPLGDGKYRVTTYRVAGIQGNVFYKDYYKTKNRRYDWLDFDPKSYPKENRPVQWLMPGTLKVKIDNAGSELTGKGNIGVKGIVSFYIDEITQVVSRPTIARPTTPATPSTPPVSDVERRRQINEFLWKSGFTEAAIHNSIQADKVKQRIEGGFVPVTETVKRTHVMQEQITQANIHEIYPGMLIVVNDALGTPTPTQANIRRGKLKIMTTLPMSTGNSREVLPDASGNLCDGVNSAILQIVDAFTKTGREIPARWSDTEYDSESAEGLAVKAGVSASFSGVKAAANLEVATNSYTRYVMTEFTQEFFTATAEFDTSDPSQLFDPRVTVSDLKAVFGNRPVIFVKSVKYGRRAWLTERLTGSNKTLMQSLTGGGFGVSVNESLTSSRSELQYAYKCDVDGGSQSNADKIFGTGMPARLTSVPDLPNNPKETRPETSAEYFKRVMDLKRQNIIDYKKSHTTENISGTKTYDCLGAVLSYKAQMPVGRNFKDITFWPEGTFRYTRWVPVAPVKVDVFDCLKSTGLTVNISYTLYDVVNGQPVECTLQRYNVRRSVSPKSWMSQIVLPANVYRVTVLLVNNRTGLRFSYTYLLPCANICIGWLRPGRTGSDTANWFFGGEDDSWYNGGQD